MKPIVSIITPTFNHEKYIEECIQSVLAQTIGEWEMIIIDDGSTDNTPDVVRQFHDPRIRSLVREHRGINRLVENYNEALGLSRGEYIVILEGDDFIPANRLEIQLPAFEDEGIVLSHGKYVYALDKKNVVYPTLFKDDILNNEPVGTALKAFLCGFNPVGTQSVMARKSALLEIGGFVQSSFLPLVDYPTWMKLSLTGRFMYIPQVLGYWRRHPFSTTLNKSEEILHGYIRYCDEFITSFKDRLMNLGLKEFMENRGAMVYLSLAWIRISSHEWKEAKQFAEESWRRAHILDWVLKMRILITLISVRLHLNIPFFLKSVNEYLYRR